MAAGGKADNGDAIGCDEVVARASPDDLNCALGIHQWNRQQIAISGQPVLQYESAESASGEPVGNLPAFEISGETVISAAWQDDDGGAVVIAVLRFEDG